MEEDEVRDEGATERQRGGGVRGRECEVRELAARFKCMCECGYQVGKVMHLTGIVLVSKEYVSGLVEDTHFS